MPSQTAHGSQEIFKLGQAGMALNFPHSSQYGALFWVSG